MSAGKEQTLYRIFQAFWLLAVVVVGIPLLIIVFAGLTHTNMGIHISEPIRLLMGVIGLVGILSGIATGIIKSK